MRWNLLVLECSGVLMLVSISWMDPVGTSKKFQPGCSCSYQ